jgi:UDPglucose 6-dehydrogenase
MKISFISAVAAICESVGANVEEVCQGIGSDSRIGPRFLNPGIGYGGSFFPKDLLAFLAVARECGYDFRLLDEVMRINEEQRKHFLRKVGNTLWILRGKRLGVLGLAFKGERRLSHYRLRFGGRGTIPRSFGCERGVRS